MNKIQKAKITNHQQAMQITGRVLLKIIKQHDLDYFVKYWNKKKKNRQKLREPTATRTKRKKLKQKAVKTKRTSSATKSITTIVKFDYVRGNGMKSVKRNTCRGHAHASQLSSSNSLTYTHLCEFFLSFRQLHSVTLYVFFFPYCRNANITIFVRTPYDKRKQEIKWTAAVWNAPFWKNYQIP